MQLSYNTDKDRGVEGGLADSGTEPDVLSRVSEEAAAFSFGKMVQTGTDGDTQALLPTATGEVALGVALFSHATEVVDNEVKVQPNRMFNILHQGRVLVTPEETVVPGDDVFVRVTAGGSGLGSFRKTDPGGSAAVIVTGARWIKGGTTTTFAVLEIDRDASY